MAPAEPRSWRQVVRDWVRGAVTERLGYKGAAVFFALMLWIIARAEEPVEQIVPVRVQADIDSMRSLASPVPEVRALVAGRARDLIKLYDELPVIRRQIPPDAPESLRLELGTGDVLLPTGIDAQVRDVQPRTLPLTFEMHEARRVPVASALELLTDGSTRITAMRVDPESVTVAGVEAALARVRLVRTRADTVALRDSGAFTIPVEVETPRGVRVWPRQVTVSVRAVRIPTDTATADSARRDSLPPGAAAGAAARTAARRR